VRDRIETREVEYEGTQIYTTGAYISPVRIGNTWYWIVERLEDDSFQEGSIFNPPVNAETLEELLTNQE
jgi:hypothetical protein